MFTRNLPATCRSRIGYGTPCPLPHERSVAAWGVRSAVEVDVAGVDTLAQLNGYWAAWVEQVYHRRVRTGTGHTPLARWLAGPTSLRPAPEPDALAAVFRWTTDRTVTTTRTV